MENQGFWLDSFVPHIRRSGDGIDFKEGVQKEDIIDALRMELSKDESRLREGGERRTKAFQLLQDMEAGTMREDKSKKRIKRWLNKEKAQRKFFRSKLGRRE